MFQQAGQGGGVFPQAVQQQNLPMQMTPMQYVYQQQPGQMVIMPQNQQQSMMMVQQPGQLNQQVVWGGLQGQSQPSRR